MSKYKNVASSIFILVFFSLGSKILGLFRETLIAAKFGAGNEADVFFVAITAITILTFIVKNSITSTMIPVLAEVEKNEGGKGKQYFTNNLLNIVFLISLFVVIVGWFLAPFIIKLIAYGFEGEQFQLAVLLMRIGLPSLLFAGIVGVFRGYLQSEQMFKESATAELPYNFVYIIYLIFFSSFFGIKGVMVTTLIAVGSQILVQIPGMVKLKYKYKPLMDLKDRYIKKTDTLVRPIILSVAVNNINKIVDKSLASTLANGSISALNYGNRLKELILGVLITAITTVLFPMLSNEANKDNYKNFKKVSAYGINIILLISIPGTVGMIILGEPLVRITFERGAFDTNATSMTTGALIFYSLGLTGMALRTFLNKVYYSLQDTKTPMYNGFIAIGMNIVLSFIFAQFWEHNGIALATSISSLIMTGLLLFGLQKKIGSIGLRDIVKCSLKSLAASLIMGVVVYFIYSWLDKSISGNFLLDFIALILSSSIGLFSYLLIIYFLQVKEIKLFYYVMKKKIKK